MKQMTLLSKTIFLILLIVCGIAVHAGASEIEYTSQITSDNCFLCGDHSKSTNSQYWKQDNIGIVHLNTFDYLPLRINRYDDAGEIITECLGIMESCGLYRDDTYVNSITHPDRGYASVEITSVKYVIDRNSVQTHLCENCIQAMNCVYWSDEAAPEFAVVNFKEKTIRPLDKALTWFFSGNFGINCEYEEDGNIDLLVAYLPPRWEDASQ